MTTLNIGGPPLILSIRYQPKSSHPSFLELNQTQIAHVPHLGQSELMKKLQANVVGDLQSICSALGFKIRLTFA